MKRILFICTFVSFLLAIQIARVENPLWPGTAYYYQPWEHRDYHAMADGGLARAPYAYRVLTPWLASLFANRVIGFQVVAILALCATGMMLYALMRAFALPLPLSLFGLLLFFSLQWAVRFTLWDFWLPDPLSFLLIVIGMWALKTQNLAIFAICMTAGAFNKEAIWAISPLIFTMIPHADWKRWLLMLVPALAITIGLRLFIQVVPDEYSMVTLLKWRLSTFEPGLILQVTFGAFGPLFLLPLFSKRNAAHLRTFIPFIALCYLQLAIANNVERLVVLAFPAFIIMSMEGVAMIWAIANPERTLNRLKVYRVARQYTRSLS